MTTWPEHVTTGKRQRDHAICTWDARDFAVLANSATTALARELVAAGCPDQPWESRTPDGTRSLYGRSLHRWAKRVVSEDDRGIRFRPYVERLFPGGRVDTQTAAEEEADVA